jgi:hypothetical protein
MDQVPLTRRFLQEPHAVTSQKTPFFIVTAVKTSNLNTKMFRVISKMRQLLIIRYSSYGIAIDTYIHYITWSKVSQKDSMMWNKSYSVRNTHTVQLKPFHTTCTQTYKYM